MCSYVFNNTFSRTIFYKRFEKIFCFRSLILAALLAWLKNSHGCLANVFRNGSRSEAPKDNSRALGGIERGIVARFVSKEEERRKRWSEGRVSFRRESSGPRGEVRESSKLKNGGLFHPRNFKSRRRASPLVAPYAALREEVFPSFFPLSVVRDNKILISFPVYRADSFQGPCRRDAAHRWKKIREEWDRNLLWSSKLIKNSGWKMETVFSGPLIQIQRPYLIFNEMKTLIRDKFSRHKK